MRQTGVLEEWPVVVDGIWLVEPDIAWKGCRSLFWSSIIIQSSKTYSQLPCGRYCAKHREFNEQDRNCLSLKGVVEEILKYEPEEVNRAGDEKILKIIFKSLLS